jgi:hypothetical protein
MKLNDLAKKAGFSGTGEIAKYSGTKSRTLQNWYKKSPLKLRTAMQGAAINKLNEALRGVGE